MTKSLRIKIKMYLSSPRRKLKSALPSKCSPVNGIKLHIYALEPYGTFDEKIGLKIHVPGYISKQLNPTLPASVNKTQTAASNMAPVQAKIQPS